MRHRCTFRIINPAGQLLVRMRWLPSCAFPAISSCTPPPAQFTGSLAINLLRHSGIAFTWTGEDTRSVVATPWYFSFSSLPCDFLEFATLAVLTCLRYSQGSDRPKMGTRGALIGAKRMMWGGLRWSCCLLLSGVGTKGIITEQGSSWGALPPPISRVGR